jgi:hypothetical protein
MISRADDSGSASLTTVLLTQVFVVVAFAAFQAAMWTHARTEARALARDAASLVARSGQPVDVVAASAEASLDADSLLTNPAIDVEIRGSIVVVTVTGRAPGIIRGTSSPIAVVEALPIEGFRP